jgi:hypothetical protein
MPFRINRSERRTLACAVAVAALLAGASPAAPQDLQPDPNGIWTLQDENASISSAKLTDRFYVNGLHLGYVSGTDAVSGALQRVGSAIWGSDGQLRVAFDLTQQIYTPGTTSTPKSLPGDEPYAGLLLGTGTLYRDVPDSRSMLGLALGMVGPAALGEEVQNGFHDLIGQKHAAGWDSQLRNEPALELTSARTWRLSTGSVAGLETDVLPDLAVGLGNVRIYAQSGVNVRIGQGLASDYGVQRLSPGPSGGGAFTPVTPFAWYVFAGADGQGVLRDITLDGNDFSDGPSVKLIPYVGEVEAGLAVMAFGARLTYTQVVQTQQFQHQKGGPHQLGSLALSVRF